MIVPVFSDPFFPDEAGSRPRDQGRRVIEAEAAALASLADALDEGFDRAVELILALTGRLVVTGMGKSGHVGRKMASTFASVGVPALFIHPAEAAHGDLGMLVRGDALVALSNSGATRELLPVLRHARAHDVPIVAISSRANSPLMAQADIGLLLPAVEEACVSTLAPTSSTAMMMALGDALALVAMRGRGLSRAGFGALHPGGAIGLRMMPAAVLMHGRAALPLVGPDAPMREVVVTMTACSFGIAGVVDGDGRLVGVITDGDLRRHADTLAAAAAREVMTADPATLPIHAMAEDALALMNRRRITAVFVVEEGGSGRPAGLIHVHDFLRLGA